MSAAPPPCAEAKLGDQRLSQLANRPGWRFGGIVAAMVALLTAVWIGKAWYMITQSGEATFPADFRVFWSAAKIALEGEILDIFDISRLADVQSKASDTWMPWSYPPTFLLVVLPLGALPYGAAWALFVFISVLAILAALRPFTRSATPIWLGFALAPAAIPALFMGQTTLFWTAGLLAAFACLRREKYVLAGVFIGLLTFKPQLGVLIPVALLAMGAWRTIFSASVTTLVFAAVATLVFGVEYWGALADMTKVHFSTVRHNAAIERLMISQYSTMAGIGIPERIALSLQWAMTAVSVIGVAFAWSSSRISFDLRAAMLIAAILMSTPYLWYYESYMLVIACLFLLRAGVLGANPADLILLLFTWLGLGPALLLAVFFDLYEIPVRYIAAPLTLIVFVVCLVACFKHHFKRTVH